MPVSRVLTDTRPRRPPGRDRVSLQRLRSRGTSQELRSGGGTSHLLGCRLKLSLARGVTGGGVCWGDGEDWDTEKRLSPPTALITWLFGLWGRRGLICVGRTGRAELGSVAG